MGRNNSDLPPKGGDREEQILALAIDLFREKGYHGTSMQDIADAIGLRKGSLYHYVSSKEELLFTIFTRAVAALVEDISEIASTDEPARLRLRRAIKHHLRVVADNLSMLTIFFRELPALPPEKRREVLDGRDRYRGFFEAIITEGIARGEFCEVDPKMVTFAILGMCNGLYEWYSPQGRLSIDDIAESFTSLVLDGICRR